LINLELDGILTAVEGCAAIHSWANNQIMSESS
jgi:hypothetical protein